MKIKEVEQQTGITKANIRYYESQGLISPNRESNGYRTYDESHIKGLLRIKLLRSLGLPIESIKALCDGKVTLEEALAERKAQFQGQHQELAMSEKIITIILDADSGFYELKAEEYLALFDHEDENPIERDVNTKPIFPIRRLWARTLDFTIYNLILYLVAPGLFQTEGFNLFLIVAEILMLIVIEPFLLSTVYTTPGKLVFGMTVTSLDGRRLTYKEALNRTLLVLQHGLGFCAPFLKEYMQISSYVTVDNGGELIWEQNSELNIRDSKAWRYIVFALLFAAAMAYPAKMEFVRIFNSYETEAKYEGETPFRGDYAVDEVLYSTDEETGTLPLIRLTAEGMRISYSGNTSVPFDLIGKFSYAPPADDPTAGVWELQTGTASGDLYRLTVNSEGDVILDHYENLELESSWKLTLLDVLQVEFKNKVTRTYITPEWFEYGDFSNNIDLLKPRRFGTEFLITLMFSCEIPDTITIEEEIHRADEIKINSLELIKDEKGLFSFEFPDVDEDAAYVIYRIAHADGEIIFCVLC
ncbi:MAG: MerR family transcriptional regulator [Bacteroidales bacterium]|nr:MerR family transcriptional regulator [Bacteroidales bacterium]